MVARKNFDPNQPRKLDQGCRQVDGFTLIRDGSIIGGEFGGFRPGPFQLDHAREGTTTEDKLLQVVVRFNVLKLVFQRDAEFVVT